MDRPRSLPSDCGGFERVSVLSLPYCLIGLPLPSFLKIFVLSIGYKFARKLLFRWVATYLTEAAMRYGRTFFLAVALVLGTIGSVLADTEGSLGNGMASVMNAETADTATVETFNLGGEWEYHEDMGATRMALDTKGNGTYVWQNGHVTTTSVSGRRWQGKWMQEGNDREGGFEVVLSSDGTEAEGKWWYTRIGTYHLAPREKGGECWLTRLSTASVDVAVGTLQADSRTDK
jgi:hypothetical protein